MSHGRTVTDVPYDWRARARGGASASAMMPRGRRVHYAVAVALVKW